MPRRPRSPTRNGLQLRRLLAALAVAALAFAAQARIVRHEFVSLDDPNYITGNPQVLDGLTWAGARWALTTGYFANWHPLTWLSHMLDVEMFGTRAGGHHLVNLLLHAANAALVLLALEGLVRVGRTRAGEPPDDGRTLWQAAFVAALFAVHPLHVESVAWASERKDTLSTLFGLLTLAAYGRYAASPSIGRYLLVAGALALGLMAKPMLVTLPALLLLLDFWPLRRWQPRWAAADGAPGVRLGWLILEKAPLLALAAASSAITVLAQRAGGSVGDLATYPLRGRAWNAVLAYARYVGKTLWPSGLEFFYPYPPHEFLEAGGREPRLVAALTLLLALTAAAIAIGRRHRYVLVGWLWFVGTLVPVIGLVQVGKQALADRYTYVPLLGLFIIAAWGLPDVCRRRGLSWRWQALAALIVVAGLGGLTWRQSAVWRNSRALYEHALSVDADNPLAHYNLGVLEVDEGNFGAAREHFAAAARLSPAHPRSHYNLGIEWERVGDLDAAALCFERAVALDPEYAKALDRLAQLRLAEGRAVEAEHLAGRAAAVDRASASIQLTRGRALLRLERDAEALACIERAVELDPRFARARAWMGVALARNHRPDVARSELIEALRGQPENPEPHLGLGDLAAARRQWREAVSHYRRAAAQPALAGEASRKIGEIALEIGQTSDALRWFERAVARDPSDPRSHRGYGQALSRANRPAEAEAALQTARRLVAEQGSGGSQVRLPRSPGGGAEASAK